VGACHQLSADDAGRLKACATRAFPNSCWMPRKSGFRFRKGQHAGQARADARRLREFIGEEVARCGPPTGPPRRRWTTWRGGPMRRSRRRPRPAPAAGNDPTRASLRIAAAAPWPRKIPWPDCVIAARLGCHGVEFDTMLAADGVPVLIHDERWSAPPRGWAGGRYGLRSATRPARCRQPTPPGVRRGAAADSRPGLALCAELGLWANVEIKPAAGQEVETGRVVARHAAAAKGACCCPRFRSVALRAAAEEARNCRVPCWSRRFRRIGGSAWRKRARAPCTRRRAR
jgi:hypothetical protein